MPARTHRAHRATIEAYERALAEGAEEQAAFEAACAAFRQALPGISADVLRRLVAYIVGRAPSPAKPKRKTRRRKA
jgi:hypothetical protein